jgi:hypothetical protein
MSLRKINNELYAVSRTSDNASIRAGFEVTWSGQIASSEASAFSSRDFVVCLVYKPDYIDSTVALTAGAEQKLQRLLWQHLPALVGQDVSTYIRGITNHMSMLSGITYYVTDDSDVIESICFVTIDRFTPELLRASPRTTESVTGNRMAVVILHELGHAMGFPGEPHESDSKYIMSTGGSLNEKAVFSSESKRLFVQNLEKRLSISPQ